MVICTNFLGFTLSGPAVLVFVGVLAVSMVVLWWVLTRSPGAPALPGLGRRRLRPPGDMRLPIEGQIQAETNRRLRELQTDQSAFLASDLDKDGIVEDPEWEVLRARVEAEVRAELE